MRRGYDKVEGSIGRSYDEIKGVTMSVSRDFHMLNTRACMCARASTEGPEQSCKSSV